MQCHVAALNAFTREGFQRGEVLRKADAADDFGQLARRRAAENTQGEAGAWMDLQCTADGTDGHGHSQMAE